MSIMVKNNSFMLDAEHELLEAHTIAQELFGERCSLIGLGDNLFICKQEGEGVNCSVLSLLSLTEWWNDEWNRKDL